MKNIIKILMASALLLAFTGCDIAPKKWGSSTLEQDQVPPSTANTIKITISNQLDEGITDFKASATSDANWGSDLESSTLASGATKSYTISGLSCATLTRMDLVVTTTAGHVYRYDQDMQCDQSYTWRVSEYATPLP